ncbi:MAG: 30S ribosomal protein S12 methylthiotransferase RimO [Myxococcales bacterium]|nr:30S ribosomal protein S12 methylthiotransferase RimO [Myxococcales bacterium]
MSAKQVHFVALGCPKNRVDTERMVALARRQGLVPTPDAGDADVVVVNTCGFIEAAKQESIDTILEMAELKQHGRLESLIVAGCLSQRYPEQLARELPEVDHFLGTADLGRLEKLLSRDSERKERVVVGRPEGLEEADYERQLIGPPHTAYMKISEGCNRPCAFCIIPLMRGKQRSRTIGSLFAEARELAESGVRELILVAQDSTAYGNDLGRETDLASLLQALDEVDGIEWIRVHYAYPSMVRERLAEAMAASRKVVPYLDMPIQHVDDELLRRMRRGYGESHVWQAIESLRRAMPDVTIRSTMLLGHPGETDAAHQRLLAFLERAELDNVGAFAFSSEEGTAAHEQPDPVDPELAQARVAEVMELQRQISARKLRRLVGAKLEVMIDGESEESELLLDGRFAGQSPEIDGVVVLTDGSGQPGQIVEATVTDSSDYDLVATLDPSVAASLTLQA